MGRLVLMSCKGKRGGDIWFLAGPQRPGGKRTGLAASFTLLRKEPGGGGGAPAGACEKGEMVMETGKWRGGRGTKSVWVKGSVGGRSGHVSLYRAWDKAPTQGAAPGSDNLSLF